MISWNAARTIAVALASRTERAPASDFDYQAAVEETLRPLSDFAGIELPRGADAARRLVVADRTEWIDFNIEGFGALMEPVLKRAASGAGDVTWALGGATLTAQMGLLLGFLSSRVLGQYDTGPLLSKQEISGPGKVFLCGSGAEANEAALKLTRRTGRTRVVAAEGSFHGRTMGALSLTATRAYREPFEPLPGEVAFVPYGDVAALERAVDDRTAAVVLEPVQGEAGVVVPPSGYLRAARATTRRHGALLWLDEVQTGVGRTGHWFAHQAPDGPPVRPDVVTLAKGLGGGIPVGACIGLDGAADLLRPGHHGSTFGGNPVTAAAALATLGVIEDEDLLAHVRGTGEHLRAALRDVGHPAVVEVRGAGLLVGTVLARGVATAVSWSALDAGFIVNDCTPSVLRTTPPLVVRDEHVDGWVAALPPLLDAAVQTAVAAADEEAT